jgi:hypothetical protein
MAVQADRELVSPLRPDGDRICPCGLFPDVGHAPDLRLHRSEEAVVGVADVAVVLPDETILVMECRQAGAATNGIMTWQEEQKSTALACSNPTAVLISITGNGKTHIPRNRTTLDWRDPSRSLLLRSTQPVSPMASKADPSVRAFPTSPR